MKSKESRRLFPEADSGRRSAVDPSGLDDACVDHPASASYPQVHRGANSPRPHILINGPDRRQQDALQNAAGKGSTLDDAPAAPEREMSTTFKSAVARYLRAGRLAFGTRSAYQTTLQKWKEWGRGVPLQRLGRREIHEFNDWVFERVVARDGTNYFATLQMEQPRGWNSPFPVGRYWRAALVVFFNDRVDTQGDRLFEDAQGGEEAGGVTREGA